MGSELLLILVVAAARAFDFTNGFHDTANAMATSIATGALKPRVAVALSAVMNLVGAFVSIKVATTIATGIVDTAHLSLTLVFGAESSGASVILASSYFGYPLSTTQVVSGAVIGSGIGKRLASVRWGTARQMVGACVLTIPGAAVIGAAAWEGATAARTGVKAGALTMAVLGGAFCIAALVLGL